MHTGQGDRNIGKQRLAIVRLALVLVVAAGVDALGTHVLTVKHHDVGFLVIDPDNRVKSGHGGFRFVMSEVNGDGAPPFLGRQYIGRLAV